MGDFINENWVVVSFKKGYFQGVFEDYSNAISLYVVFQKENVFPQQMNCGFGGVQKFNCEWYAFFSLGRLYDFIYGNFLPTSFHIDDCSNGRHR